jgi:hypothetical protein
MAEDHLNHLDRNPTGEKQRAGAVAGVMQPYHWQATGLHVSLECVCDATRTEWRAVREAEDKVVIAVVGAEQRPVFRLRRPVTRQCRLSRAGKRHPAAAGLRLGSFEEPTNMLGPAVWAHTLCVAELPATDLHSRLPHRQARTIVVDVRPPQAAQLRSAKARVRRHLVQRRERVLGDVLQEASGLLRLPKCHLVVMV